MPPKKPPYKERKKKREERKVEARLEPINNQLCLLRKAFHDNPSEAKTWLWAAQQLLIQLQDKGDSAQVEQLRGKLRAIAREAQACVNFSS